jgi:dienelactone hydrolase
MNVRINRKDITFLSKGIECSAWLYLPKSEHQVPVIILAHGLGCTKEMRLDAYSERFTQAGYACFVFDYRNLGESGGTERQNINVKSQLEDWEAAISFVKNMDEVDSKRIGLFGTSFSGGHVIATAAKDKEIAAVISQCPFTSGISSSSAINLFSTIKIITLAIADVLSRLMGLKPVKINLAGPKWSTALIPVTDYQGYFNLVPEKSNFKPKVWAGIAFQIMTYEPGKSVKDVDCPIYFGICDKDTVTPAKKSSEYAAQAPRGVIKNYPYGHFEIYEGDAFEIATSDYIEFMDENLQKKKSMPKV